MNIQEEILKSVEVIVAKSLEKQNTTTTKLAIVEDIKNDKYIITLNGAKLSVYDSVGCNPEIGNSVWIQIPNGNMKNAFITGVNSNAATTYVKNEIIDSSDKKNFDDVIIFVGDDYANSPNSDISKGWINKTINLITKKCYRCSGVGGSFGNKIKFLNILKSVESSVVNKDDITKIIVCGGYNDIDNPSSSIIAGIQDFSEYVKKTYPNAVIEIGMIALTRDIINQRKLMTQVLSSYKQGASTFNNVGFIENSQFINRRYDYIGVDGVLPTEFGSELIAMGISNYIKTGNVMVSSPKLLSCNVSLDSDLFSTPTWIWSSNDNGAFVHLKISEYYPILKTPTLFNKDVLIGTIPEGYIRGLENCTFTIPVGINCNGWKDSNGRIRIKENQIYLQLMSFDYATDLWFPDIEIDISKYIC